MVTLHFYLMNELLRVYLGEVPSSYTWSQQEDSSHASDKQGNQSPSRLSNTYYFFSEVNSSSRRRDSGILSFQMTKKPSN